MKNVKCPFCEREAKTDANYIVCALCGNGYLVENEVRRDEAEKS